MKKTVIPVLLGICFTIMFSTTSAMASTVKYEIDNDSKTYSNSIYGTWTKLTTGNYGDSRMYHGAGSGEYYWIINPGSYSGSLMEYVYLNNSSFTNNRASYYANTGADTIQFIY